MAKIVTLKDKNGENIYPSTFSTLIYDNNGKSVDSALNGLRGNISSNTSDEGKSIVINDGCNHGKLSINVKGNSSQNGTPTPETPVDIISCDNPTLCVSGKNLFNLNNVMTYPKVGVTNSLLLNNSEIQFTVTRNDIYYGDVFRVGSTTTKPDIILTPVSPNTTYSFFLSNQELNKNFVSFFGSDKIAITPYTQFNASQFTFTTPSNCYYVHIRFGKGDAVVGQTYSTKIMFMQGDTISDFESYKEPQTLKIPYVLRGIGDIKDEITISDSKVEYIQRIAEETVTLNELSETSDYAGRYIGKYKIKNQYKAASYGNFCTSAKYKSWALPSQTEWVISTSSRAIYFSPPLTSEYTADTLNAYLSDKPITLIGCLEIPITTDITDTEFGQSLLKLYCNSPTSTIYTDSNVDITATYEISTSNYFQNKLAELKTKLGGV